MGGGGGRVYGYFLEEDNKVESTFLKEKDGTYGALPHDKESL